MSFLSFHSNLQMKFENSFCNALKKNDYWLRVIEHSKDQIHIIVDMEASPDSLIESEE